MQAAQIEVAQSNKHDAAGVEALVERCRQQEPDWTFAVEQDGGQAAVLVYDERGAYIGKL